MWDLFFQSFVHSMLLRTIIIIKFNCIDFAQIILSKFQLGSIINFMKIKLILCYIIDCLT